MLLDLLQKQKDTKLKDGIYSKTQIEFSYHSNRIEGCQLSYEQTRSIFESGTIVIQDQPTKVDDIFETNNHFYCVDYIIDHALEPLSEKLIKTLHQLLKNHTSDERRYEIGEYKKIANVVGNQMTSLPENVSTDMETLLAHYHQKKVIRFEDILDFHVQFERIHPFQDGNGRVGRLIMFKECLKHQFVPFIIRDEWKMFYYRGLREWDRERGYLMDTCLTAQDLYKQYLKE